MNTAVSHLVAAVEQCVAAGDLRLGRCLHSFLFKTALNHHTLLANRLVELYSKCGSFPCARSAFDDLSFKNRHSYNVMLAAYSRSAVGGGDISFARHLFDRMTDRDLVSYNTMISSLGRHGHYEDAVKLFVEMPKAISMDKFTVVSVATACASLGGLGLLRQFHATVIVSGIELNVIMANALIDAYGKCGDPDYARFLFDGMGSRDVISWTSLIGAYTLAHRLAEARLVFDKMPERNEVSWTALISGCEQNGEAEAALELFEQMMGYGFVPTPFTLVSVLSACASLGLITRGKQVHGFMTRRCIGLDYYNVFTFNALIDMYAKCGDLAAATALFDRMPERNVVTWNSMITGLAQNGRGEESLAMYERMAMDDVKPNYITFLGVLSGCSHVGLVSEGQRILDLMETKYGISPRPEHHAAFVDSLGRNRQLEEAMEFIEGLHSEDKVASAGTWGALLGACRVHANLELAQRAAEALFKLEPDNGSRYVMLFNIYSEAGLRDDAKRVRQLMKGKGLKKDPGYSWIEVRNTKHMFVADDKSHSQIDEIQRMLGKLIDQMKEETDDEEYIIREFGIIQDYCTSFVTSSCQPAFAYSGQ